MIKITMQLMIPDAELEFQFITAQGPGGQNVNKVATAVQLRFDVLHSPSLPEEVRARILMQQQSRLTTRGELIIKANRFRTQERNKHDAIKRLVAIIHQATLRPKKRKKTKPTKASIQKRLQQKKQQGKKKQLRRKRIED